jgi:hypothetical protein
VAYIQASVAVLLSGVLMRRMALRRVELGMCRSEHSVMLISSLPDLTLTGPQWRSGLGVWVNWIRITSGSGLIIYELIDQMIVLSYPTKHLPSCATLRPEIAIPPRRRWLPMDILSATRLQCVKCLFWNLSIHIQSPMVSTKVIHLIFKLP